MDNKIRILFLSANSFDTSRLRLDAEVRDIEEALQSSEYREKFILEKQGAVRVNDLQSHFFRYKPNIVHFSGHGNDQGEICLEDDSGHAVIIPASALTDLFSLFSKSIDCVFLNSCYSQIQASSIAKYIRYVIGMPLQLHDDAAIKFAQSFYRALGFGKDVPMAFRSACLQLDLLAFDLAARPVLLPDSALYGWENIDVITTPIENVEQDVERIPDVPVVGNLHVASLRIMAGPGTGKTTAMRQRVAQLLLQGVNPTRILAVTFTRVAAAELVKSLGSLGIAGCGKMRVGTLHAFCFALLSKQNVFDYLNRVARPIYTFKKSGVLKFEGKAILDDLRHENNEFGRGQACTKRVIAFEAAWARLQSEEPGWPEDTIDRQFHDSLLRWLQFHQAILIGELIPESLKYLRDNPLAAELSAFDYVLVDEYQDLNRAEQVLVDIIGKNSRCCVIGDADQSIYSFRHAHPEGIMEYKETHFGTVDESFEECRRCPQRVVKMANHLIKYNYLTNSDPRLKPSTGNPVGDVHIVQWETLEDEAAGLASYVSNLLAHETCNPGDILILSPRSLIGYEIRNQLVALAVPTYSFYHDELLESEESQKAFTLLHLLVNPDDGVSLRYWLGLGSPSSNAGEYARIRNYCENNGITVRALLEDIIGGSIELKGIGKIIQNYKSLSDNLEILNGLIGYELVDELFPEDAKWTQPIRHLAKMIVEEDSKPQVIYDELMAKITQPEMPEQGQYVRVMSLHKSKGLTAKHVIVAGCMEGIIPRREDDKSITEQTRMLQEQRRLFYVSITRCRESLVLSSVNKLEKNLARRMNANTRAIASDWTFDRTNASSFIGELGPDAPRSKSGKDWMSRRFQDR